MGIAVIIAGSCLGAVVAPVAAAAATAPTHMATSSRVRFDDPMAAVAIAALTDLTAYTRSGDGSVLIAYVVERDQIATEVANRLGMDPVAMTTAWQNADFAHQTALMAAFTQLGVPYHRNSSKAGEGFDCSGLTTYAWGIAGTTLVRQSGSQIRNAAARTAETAMAGDLVYYPGHVMLWLGIDNAIVHAPYTGRNVEVDTVGKHRSLRYGNPIG
ncbi:MAG: hypothetical protein JWL72_4903 [Ilumatobacteraceae bacterium]|nr:hypothetical protein [Ilumatobacteraceae bacterium]MCU1392005.1 hypothetical protein [Ilumatobacteraceae bacterium]